MDEEGNAGEKPHSPIHRRCSAGDRKPAEDQKYGQDQRDGHEQRPRWRSLEEAGHHQRHHRRQHAEEHVEHREQLDAIAGEEQGVDAALAESQPGPRNEHQGHDEPDHHLFAGTNPDHPPSRLARGSIYASMA